jgi:hypothetical protein
MGIDDQLLASLVARLTTLKYKSTAQMISLKEKLWPTILEKVVFLFNERQILPPLMRKHIQLILSLVPKDFPV